MKELTPNELKSVQMEILRNIDSFCNENKIEYTLAYGSLLGAVRHKGYIPWDDDVDIAMPRLSYERFVTSFVSEKYPVLECSLNAEYPFPFAKVCKNGTIVAEESSVIKEHHGVDVDIFPIDYLPSNRILISLKYTLVNALRSVIDIKSIPIRKRNDSYKNVILYIGKLLLRYISPNSISVLINKFSAQTKMGAKMGIVVWGYGKRQVVSKSTFEQYQKVSFETHSFSAVSDYDTWLTATYGDYMKLPPVEQRQTHHRRKAYWIED